jgi:hypothetical protein
MSLRQRFEVAICQYDPPIHSNTRTVDKYHIFVQSNHLIFPQNQHLTVSHHQQIVARCHKSHPLVLKFSPGSRAVHTIKRSTLIDAMRSFILDYPTVPHPPIEQEISGKPEIYILKFGQK